MEVLIIMASYNKQPEPAKLVDRRELADLWGCHVNTLKRYEKRGILPHLKIGGRVVYRAEEIQKAEKAGEVLS